MLGLRGTMPWDDGIDMCARKFATVFTCTKKRRMNGRVG
jgi:hypothetical protein